MEPIEYTKEQTKHTVRIPAGKCPLKLGPLWEIDESCPPETIVVEWFWRLRELGLRRGEFYTAEAMVYWLGYEFDCFSLEYRYLEGIIYEYARTIGDYKAPP